MIVHADGYVSINVATQIARLIEEFNNKAGLPKLSPVKALKAVRLTAEKGVLIYNDASDSPEPYVNGFIAGAILEDPMRHRNLCVETGWYTKPDCNGVRLLRRFEKIAAERGCDEVRMSTLCGMEHWDEAQKAHGLLNRMGYEDAEMQLVLPL